MERLIAVILLVLVSSTTAKTVKEVKDNTDYVPPRQDDPIIIEPRQDDPVIIEPRETLETSVDKKPDTALDLDRALSATCNGAAVSAAGTTSTNFIAVQSTNFPNAYLDNESCKYSVTVPANSQLLISVRSMNVECPYDYVQFAFNDSPPVATLCPKSTAAKLYAVNPQATAYTFRVLFTSDESITYTGFSLNLYLNVSGTVTTTTVRPTTTTATTTTTRPTTTTTTTTTRPASTTTAAPGACTCGRWGVLRDAEGRIVGGSIAAPNSLPYQAGIWTQTSRNPFCGGTLISRNYVLTAAHCTPGMTASQLRVALRDIKFNANDGEIFINVKTIKNHPNYNSNSQDNDFALLELASPAPISSTVGIACLPPDVSQTFEGTTLTISGWGTISSNGPQSPDLKVGTVQGLNNNACNTAYQGGITANMICAGTSNFDTDTCQGDSGGPLVASLSGKATLVGVTSFGTGCAQSPYPGVYARVTAQKSWILANSDAGTCQN